MPSFTAFKAREDRHGHRSLDHSPGVDAGYWRESDAGGPVLA
jgi:hypothetical protein